jgi:hypothetical protein
MLHPVLEGLSNAPGESVSTACINISSSSLSAAAAATAAAPAAAAAASAAARCRRPAAIPAAL